MGFLCVFGFSFRSVVFGIHSPRFQTVSVSEGWREHQGEAEVSHFNCDVLSTRNSSSIPGYARAKLWSRTLIAMYYQHEIIQCLVMPDIVQ